MSMIRRFSVFASFFLLAASVEARKPNVVLIMVDDLGYQDLGCFGHPEIRTPVLDKLADEGARLTDFHAGSAVCTPSRMAMLTGAYPVRVGWQRGVVGFKLGMRDGMSPDALTMGDVFKKAGYATGISGKWHIGDLPETRPHAQGFDWTYYIPTSNNQTDLIRSGDEVVVQPFENRLLTRMFTDEAMGFIRENQDEPFFLYLPYTAPHFPVEAHPDWEGRSDFGAYGDVVEEVDHCVGEIVALLDDLEIREHTMVIFFSDNGPQGGQAASAYPYRGMKWSALEGGTRVPFIINRPGEVPAGREFAGLVSAIDLLPTLSRACGIDLAAITRDSPKIDGVDVWDVLSGKSERSPREELLFWHGMSVDRNEEMPPGVVPEPHAIRMGEWKLFFDRRHALEGMGVQKETPAQVEKLAAYREALDESGPNPPFLFNVNDDLSEIRDRSSDFPEMIDAMRTRAEVLMAEIRAGKILPIVKP